MVWFAKQKCTHPKDRLTNDESVAILLYTIEWEPCEKSFYVLLNVALRAEKRDTLRPWFSYLRLMINALQKLPAVPETTVYRGDETITWWGFSSCTRSIETLNNELFSVLNANPGKVFNRIHFTKMKKRFYFFQLVNSKLWDVLTKEMDLN